jgi:hypothetical protein
MAKEVLEEKSVETTGIPDNVEEQEYDLLESLLMAAEDNEALTPVRIERNGVHRFTFRVHALSEKERGNAYKAASTYEANPAGKHLPKIKKDTDESLYRSYLIYYATADEDRRKIWGQKKVKDKYNLMHDAETIDCLLKSGEKDAVLDLIAGLSGFGSNSVTTEEFAKN